MADLVGISGLPFADNQFALVLSGKDVRAALDGILDGGGDDYLGPRRVPARLEAREEAVVALAAVGRAGTLVAAALRTLVPAALAGARRAVSASRRNSTTAAKPLCTVVMWDGSQPSAAMAVILSLSTGANPSSPTANTSDVYSYIEPP